MKAPFTEEQESRRQLELEISRGDPNSQKKPAYGVIVDQRTTSTPDGQPVFEVRIKLDDRISNIQKSIDGFYKLGYPIDFIAQVFGDDLIGRRCRLEYGGAGPNSGIVYLFADSRFIGNLEKMSEVEEPITLLAPAGSII